MGSVFGLSANMRLFWILSFLIQVWVAEAAPNIVIVLTDDQDVALGGLTPMVMTQQLIADMGVTFDNAFVAVPICCPSRSVLLTGRLPHNVGVANNSAVGGCANQQWRDGAETQTFAARLHRDAGYRTFYAGKYLNQYGHPEEGGTAHVPPGWDWWLGLVGNSRYYNYTLSVNGTAKHFTDTYLTDFISQSAKEFLRQSGDEPFLLVAATPAPHAPFTPAPRHQHSFRRVAVPRNANFNTGNNTNKHWLLQMSPAPLPTEFLPTLDSVFRRRWQTLLAVDDLVLALATELQNQQRLDDTFFIVTSDHGYHVGQFAQPWDKRQPYEADIRVPLLVRGPGVPRGKHVGAAVSLVDLAATVLDIAGLGGDESLDGPSMLPLMLSPQPEPGAGRTMLVEYKGEGDDETVGPECPFIPENNLSQCSGEFLCKCQDSRNNTYSCLRHLSDQRDFLYCRFLDEQDFEEFYDLRLDPYQLDNGAMSLDEAEQTRLRDWLARSKSCQGKECWDLPEQPPTVQIA